jgi:UDP-N-acetylglucosamine diphosphorylase / glucose-1-phosphate thymidylyltransferase / UDP-N-acetylgalactosamine diphosphorylase / glucosamine-1-phosphate N-acetyltransferase / galactosamine-1-phosphate N-acetyltransferase
MKDFRLFDLKHTLMADFFGELNYPWELLPRLGELILALGPNLPPGYRQMAENVWVAEGTFIEKSALIQGPAIIGGGCQIRHNAFIRENVVIGAGAVIGNASEVKNALLFDGVQAPHFNYLGDAILGHKAHLGAGAILSNFKSTGDEIKVWWDGQWTPSGLNKLGGLIGDRAEIGCNAVVFPGGVLGRDSVVYPLCPVRGAIPERHILKNDGTLTEKR